MYSGKTGFIRAKEVIFRQSGCIRAKVMNSGEVVVFGKKMDLYVQNGCIQEKVVVFEQSGCIRAKVTVFGQKWL